MIRSCHSPTPPTAPATPAAATANAPHSPPAANDAPPHPPSKPHCENATSCPPPPTAPRLPAPHARTAAPPASCHKKAPYPPIQKQGPPAPTESRPRPTPPSSPSKRLIQQQQQISKRDSTWPHHTLPHPPHFRQDATSALPTAAPEFKPSHPATQRLAPPQGGPPDNCLGAAKARRGCRQPRSKAT